MLFLFPLAIVCSRLLLSLLKYSFLFARQWLWHHIPFSVLRNELTVIAVEGTDVAVDGSCANICIPMARKPNTVPIIFCRRIV